ncbi:MAG: diguanylate cyclase, partial [Burkholderiaceae bacterium]|nr:diguanylate cyclase [Burkholderiaceae bacterium]
MERTLPVPGPNLDCADATEALMQFLYRAPIGLAQTSLGGDIEMINPMSAQLLMPLSPNGSLDNLFTTLDAVAPQLRHLVADFHSPSGVVCESIRIPLDQSDWTRPGPQVLSISLMKLDESRLMAVLADATVESQREQQGLARRLRDAARTDSLTRMPNRAAVRELIEQALHRAPFDPGYDFVVLFINCDRFQQINNALGHGAGDEVLGLMSDRLRSILRNGDLLGRTGEVGQMAARIGGDEFVIVLDDLHRPDDVHGIARRLLDVLGKPYDIGHQPVHCNVSMGIVLRSQVSSDTNADTVLQDANIAMVEAKRAGGARYVVFEPAMQERAARRGGIEAELHTALADGQLFVVYQPVVGLRDPHETAASAGVECLVRWRHPVRGVVPPLEFIPVAEECGLIGAVGDFVLSTACRQFMQWQADLGPRAPRVLAVNLSRAQLTQPGFVDRVADLLRANDMQAHQLQLEITESLAAQDEFVQARLHELKA